MKIFFFLPTPHQIRVLTVWCISILYIFTISCLHSFSQIKDNNILGLHQLKNGASKNIPTQKPCLNINIASADELIQLSGIGPKLANQIVEYRHATKGFKNLNDLDDVKGLGPKKINKLKTQICF